MLPIIKLEMSAAQSMAGMKLPKTILTLLETAATSEARRSQSKGTEKAETQKSSSATTKPDTAPHFRKLNTPLVAGTRSVSQTGAAPIM